jgi:hypothetical protein
MFKLKRKYLSGIEYETAKNRELNFIIALLIVCLGVGIWIAAGL